MEYQRVSNTDLNISRITLGCRAFTGGDYCREQSEDDAFGTILSALDLGINSFDTSPDFADGASEEILGKALSGRRDEALIFSKVSEGVVDADSLIKSCSGSLRRLNTDRIDFLKVDCSRSAIVLDELKEGLRIALERGMIRAFGVSGFPNNDLLDCEGAVFAQMPYSLVNREIENGSLEDCIDSDLTAIAYGSLQHGLLAGRHLIMGEGPSGRRKSLEIFNSVRGKAGASAVKAIDFFSVVGKLDEISHRYGIKLVHLALGWALNQSNIGSVVVGARLPYQIVEDVSVLDINFSLELLEEISAVSSSVDGVFERRPDLLKAIAQ